MLSENERKDFADKGFFLRPAFASTTTSSAMLEDVVAICRAAEGAGIHEGTLIMPENNLSDRVAPSAEERISKIFRLHRRPVFRDFIEDPRLLGLVTELLGPRVDCFLSQFIFKNPGAWGQPWHQDSFYFPFDHTPQIGLWLAISDATLKNGCLWVLPGSHREPVHAHVTDRRPGANLGYVEIVDHDMSEAIPVLIQAGDLLVFHSHLMHRSMDNQSDGIRAAMVFHCAKSGTKIRTPVDAPVNDWMALPPAPTARTRTDD
jgi:ectoine hydroxylase-related dioxygenase (phytanoyl-CoA dioxygenase family)